MNTWSAWKAGWGRVWTRKRLLLWLYLLNLGAAAILLFPFRRLVEEMGKTDLSSSFRSGAQFDALYEFYFRHELHFKSLGFAAVGLGFLYLLFNVFLSAGVLAALDSGPQVTLRGFFRNVGRFGWRFLRLFILQTIALAAAVAGYSIWLKDRIDETAKAYTTDVATTLWNVSGMAVVLLVAVAVVVVFDYARIRAVVENRRGMIKTAFLSVGFCVRRLFSTVPLFGLGILSIILLYAGYLGLENLVSILAGASFVALLLLQQLVILGRLAIRLAIYASERQLFESFAAGKSAPMPETLPPNRLAYPPQPWPASP